MAAVSAWWAGIPAVTASLECGNATHTLRWADGALTAAHHDDLEGERAMAALAGTSCACLDTLSTWEAHATDLTVLTLAARGPGDPLGRPGKREAVGAGTHRAALHPGVRARRGGSPPEPPDSSEKLVADLLHLGGGLPHRLSATVAAHWVLRAGESPDDPAVVAAVPALEVALISRARAGLAAWSGAPVACEVAVGPAGGFMVGDPPTLTLPLHWLLDVWAFELTVLAGHFTVSAARSADGSLTLGLCPPDLSPPHLVVMAAAGG